ncbi:MAG: BrnT family toxin [Candidatus Hydrogenedentes bacterium]|nr:BrnT family toxin [Candidatus Hydrogenedentota bacterium]
MEFQWDRAKASVNERKHGVAFSEAITVFGDPLALTFPDPDHSRDEQRLLTFGMSRRCRMLVIAHMRRGAQNRIISARLMNRRERVIYEEG